MKIMTFIILTVFLSVGRGEGKDYFDVGSLGCEAWTPSSNYIEMALVLSEYYCRYRLSNQEGCDIFYLYIKNETNNIVDNKPKKDFLVNSVIYTNYVRSIRAFIQPHAMNKLYIIAVQHSIKTSINDITNITNAPPFTIYFNATTGQFGKNLNLPLVSYSPGPPYSFQIKGAY